MKYTDFESIDKYCRQVADTYFNSLTREFNPEDIKDAFDFMRKYEKTNRFEKATMENAKVEALGILNHFENISKAKKDAALADKKEKIRLRNELTQNAPGIWENDISPKFMDVIKELESFTKIPGFEPYILKDNIEKELSKIENVAMIDRQKQKVYVR